MYIYLQLENFVFLKIVFSKSGVDEYKYFSLSVKKNISLKKVESNKSKVEHERVLGWLRIKNID